MSIWVCGEVLIDLLPAQPERIAALGGGPANTARALGRLGHDVHFIDGISTDSYGSMAQEKLLADGVKLDLVDTSQKPTARAIVSIGSDGDAKYEFEIEGTATFDFSANWLPDPSRYKPQVLHIGTLATIVEPGASILYDWAISVGEFAPIVFDPNIRPSVMNDRGAYESAVEKWAAISSVIKVSDGDLAWLYPDQSVESIAERWIKDGVVLVVVTRAGKGLIGFTEGGSEEVSGINMKIEDTVGAGDTVGAIIVEALVEKGILSLQGLALQATLARAAYGAAITCSRKGAEPPYRHELAPVTHH
jgi:fructokinase